MYPQIKVQEAFDRSMTIATPKSSMSYFLQGLLSTKGTAWTSHGRDGRKGLGGFSALVFRKQRLGRTDLSSDRCSYMQYHAKKLPGDLIHEIYGKVLESSVTRLERYAACACAHYLQYGLGLSERQMQDFTPADFGNVFHFAMILFQKACEKNG